MLESLGAYIRLTRRRRNLTLERLAELAKVSRSQLAQLEKGHNVSVTFLLKVAGVLELTEIPVAFLTLRAMPPDLVSLFLAADAVLTARSLVENAQRGLDGAMTTIGGLLVQPTIPSDAMKLFREAGERILCDPDREGVDRALREIAEHPERRPR